MGFLQRMITAVATVLLTLSVCATADAGHDVTEYCKLASAQIPNRFFFPGSTTYNSSEASYFSGQESELKPGCIFRPQQTSEVAHFMRLITSPVQGCATKPRFAVRCGGHTAFAKSANVNGGITVDMRAMNKLTLNADKTVASVGGGSIWADIYRPLSPLNLTVMGGRQQGLGVGGLGTGGGIHFLSRQHGWVHDNIYGYEVVLANGTIVTATAASHRDLWLALKGGSNNFGIVTRFDLATFNLNAMWGGAMAVNYTPANLDAHASAFSHFMRPENFDPKAHGVVLLAAINGSYTIDDTIYYTAPIDNPPAWANFTSIEPKLIDQLGVSTASKLVDAGTGKLGAGVNRANAVTFTFKSGSPAVYHRLFKIWEEGTKALSHIQAPALIFLVQPLPVTNGTNSFGNEPGRKDLVIGGHQNGWGSASDDAAVQRVTYAITSKQIAYLKQQGLYVDFKYLNYADINQDVIASFGPAAGASLRAASRKYDPAGVFQKQISGGFKLGIY